MATPAALPLLSVILPTDTFETITPVLQRLRQLAMPERLEVVLVSPEVDALRAAIPPDHGFHSVRICPVATLAPLGRARARGVLMASAPYLFPGETHSYLCPGAEQQLILALQSGQTDVAVPGFVNGNPTGVFSWAAFLINYARWSAALPEAPCSESPAYNFIVARETLLEFGPALPTLLSNGELFNQALHARGRRVRLLPVARIDHVNIEAPWTCIHEHFLIGVSIGGHRAPTWSWPRRLLHIAGSWLVPVVLFARSWRGMRHLLRSEPVPLLTLPTVLLLYLAKAIGEVVGYAGRWRPSHLERMTTYEIRRLDYASPCQPR